MSAERTCLWLTLPGFTDYGEALELQRSLARARVDGDLSQDLLILLEHPRVITLGRGAQALNIVATTEELRRRGVEVHEVERGGDVTYHGPGQLVGYPIIDLRRHKQDLHWYLRRLEDVLLQTLAVYGVVGRRVPGYTGVWVEDRKIASIGVHVTRWVTFHGFALNVNTRLEDFELIVPCGIEAVQMTSLEKETGSSVGLAEVGERTARGLAEVFDLAIEPITLERLRESTCL